MGQVIAIMQPYFLPYIGYWQLIKIVDKFVIYDDVNYIKGGWINRNNLLLNGKVFMFNLILSGASLKKLINEVLVNDDQPDFLKTIQRAYGKAPFFKDIFSLMNNIIEFKSKNLGEFIGNSILKIADYLNFNTEFIYSSTIKKDNTLRAQDKIIHICKILGATEYINAIGGQKLYDKELFKQNKIELKFLKTEITEYKQFNNDFIPNLSILDLLMFNSAEKINVMLDKFELI